MADFTTRGMGALRQTPDARDVSLDLESLPLHRDTLPASVDLRLSMPPIWDQGSTNACTAYASTAAMVYQRRKQHLSPDMPAASKVFTYWYTRKREGTAGQDVGASIRDAFKSLANEGLVQDQNWPDGATQLEMDPGAWWQSVYQPWIKGPQTHKLNGLYDITSDPTAVGKHHRLQTYRAVPPDLASIKLSLANGFAVVFAFVVYESFWSTDSTGAMPVPNPATEREVGSHAVVACGYDAQDRVTGRNSWGPNFGQFGHFYIPSAFWSLGLAFDAWTPHSAAG